MAFRPMLSATVTDLAHVRLPVWASPKLDGIRATVLNGQFVSRSGKPIPNVNVQSKFDLLAMSGFDGELIVGEPTHKDCFRNTTSVVMSLMADASSVRFYAFDYVSKSGICPPFTQRYSTLCMIAQDMKNVSVLPQIELKSYKEIEEYEVHILGLGYEGVMLRDKYGMYKNGRSTMNEQWLMKLKRFEDSEALVLGVEERMHNANEATIDSLGYTERSSHQENLIGRGDLGALRVRDCTSRVEFSIGTGFDDQIRRELWDNKPFGRIVKYKYFPSGSKEKPRFPVFLGFRTEEDL